MKVRCPTCGKRATLADGDAGLLTLCPACGASYRVPAAPPKPPPAVQAAPIVTPTPSASSNWGWVLLWVGAGIAALIAIAAISWGLYDWNQTVRAQKLARAAQLKDQAELLLATGRLADAQSRYDDLEAFAAGSPWPEMRKMADDLRRELSDRKRALLASGGTFIPRAPSAADKAHANAALAKTGAGTTSTNPARQQVALVNPAPAPSAAAPPPLRSVEPEPLPSSASDPEPRHSESSLDGSAGPYAVSPATRPAGSAGGVPPPARPPAHAMSRTSHALTDEQIGAAIARGVDNLLAQFDPDTHLMFGAEQRDGIAKGEDILCVYALMQCQQATNDPRLNPHDALMKGLIDAMKGLDLNKYSYETYARGLRATALALYNRPEDRGILNADATTLVRGSHGGGYTYAPGRLGPGGFRFQPFDELAWDNSNSQYGLLGVWSAAEVGFEVPEAYWAMVQGHWTKTQDGDGTWGYHTAGGTGTHSMTCAGLASLFVTHDYLDAPKFGTAVGRDPFTPALGRGLRWLESGRNAVELNRGGYDLYGLERVGLASGFKFFGNHEWYRELAARALLDQQPDGGWRNVVETAYHLLFLSRGRHPILMNKVRFDGYWANRPRDAANLARFVGYELERPLNWQVVPIGRDWTDWADSPILYLSSHKPVPLSEAAYGRIRAFVENGGVLYMQADGGAPEFDAFAREAAHKLFPAYEMTPLPANHPLCGTVFKIKPDDRLFMVSNGSRILMLYADEDLSKSWQLRDNKNKPSPFELGTNLFIYATGKRDLRNHLVSTYIPPVDVAPDVTYRVARLKYPGNWDPEPAAWQRFGRWFQLNTGYGLDVVEVPIKDLKPGDAPIAHLTGTARYDLTAAEADAIKHYVESGGVLLVDLCGGTGPFDRGLQGSLYFKSFAADPPHVMAPTHPMLNASSANGMDELAHPVLRPYATDVLGRSNGLGLPEEIVAGKGRVIFTSLDITSGLLGTSTWGILGYDPNYAQSLVKNAILWALDGHPEQAPVAAR